MIEVTKYYPAENPDYAGNPFITLLPALSPDTLDKVMTNVPAFDPERSEHAGHLRIQYVMALAEYFIPLDHQVEFAWNLWSLICEGYKRRLQESGDETLEFSLLCDAIATGQTAPHSARKIVESPWCATLIGTPGVGKSCSVASVLKKLGFGFFHHRTHGDVFQLLSLTIEPAKNATGKALAKQIFLELRKRALETGHAVPYATGKIPDTESALLIAIEVFVDKLNLGILVIDEIQHLFRGTGAKDDDAMKFLTSLINKLKIPMLLIGTWPCLALLGLEGRLGRRSYSPASAYFYRMKNDLLFQDFLVPLFELQYVRMPTPLNAELADRMYHHTQGIQDLVVKLFSMVQIEAIASGREEISVELINEVALKHIPVIAPWIRQMRNGAGESDLRIYDDEPVDVAEYLRSFMAAASARASRAAFVRNHAAFDSAAKTLQVQDAIIAAGVADEETAAALASVAVKETPKTPVADIVQRVIQETRPKAPRPTKATNPKRKAEVVRQFMALEEDDLRRVAFVATQEGQAVGKALQQAGYLKLCLEDAVA